MKAGRGCELCENGEAAAALYCPSDSAFLCWDCDSKVHHANFLVARHLRSPLCCKCKGLIITDNPISGAGFQPFHPICRFCSSQRDYISPPDDDLQYSLSSSPSSGCISYAESSSNITPPKRSVDFNRFEKDKIVSSISVTELCSSSNSTISSSSKKGKSGRESRRRNSVKVDSKTEKEEGVLVSWCKKLGLSNSMICGVVVPVAVEAFGFCSKEYKRTVLPWRRVCLTASLWFSLRLCGDKSASTWQVLKRLEQISGVPAKLMFAAEAKMASVLGRRRRFRSGCHQLVEGWAETTQ